jgi:hypothetical protein
LREHNVSEAEAFAFHFGGDLSQPLSELLLPTKAVYHSWVREFSHSRVVVVKHGLTNLLDLRYQRRPGLVPIERFGGATH